jgi:hypothetical protein
MVVKYEEAGNQDVNAEIQRKKEQSIGKEK